MNHHNPYRMPRRHDVEDIIEKLDLATIKDVGIFRVSLGSLLDGDVGMALGTDREKIREQFKRAIACYEIRELIAQHTIVEDKQEEPIPPFSV